MPVGELYELVHVYRIRQDAGSLLGDLPVTQAVQEVDRPLLAE